ncbi:MOSC domain protein [Lacunisphaera limnophila]|uniref:MOSC domain protein n=1 Tax=Lacunisphaera limnophila TaxID=1838286 RepID=A0A1D8AVA5_9BACT|nr:MOSC N-terminal beta barrel domain-containing protein [Lacunisphaera limnophila]AOS44837.1 MOSC domain protein [Lacunisphaera limnophila]
MHVAGLFLYPVKSLRGCAVPAVELDALGFVGDRRFLVVDPTGKFLTQRTVPRMALITARLSAGTMTLSADGAGQIVVPTAPDPHAPVRLVSIWKSEGLQAEDCGPVAAAWLSTALGQTCHLVRIGPAFSRPIIKATARPGDVVSFADAYPLLALSEGSLAHLNDRIQENHGEPVTMDRFRPNLVIDGCAAFAEDTWTRVRIGDTVLRNGGPCARCIMTTTDQLTGERLGKEPLKTLATFRRDATDPSDVNFGVNLIHETKLGTIRLGDAVMPL